MKENDIRPAEAMDGQRAAMLTDAGRMLARRREFVLVNCPACGSDKASYQWNKYGFDYVECRHCATLYVNPRPTPEILAEMYATSVNYAYWNERIYPESQAARIENLIKPRVERVTEAFMHHHIGVDLGILEVGCGYGTFLDEIGGGEFGWFERVVGVDPTSPHPKAHKIPIEQAVFDRPFNIVVAFEVIEHTFSPSDFIAACTRHLAPGGLLILTCPNGKGFDFLTLGRDCIAVDHEHLNYFNPGSLSLLARRCGLEVLECYTPGLLDVELVRKQRPYSGDPFLSEVFSSDQDVQNNFQRFLSDNKLSSHMWLVARKPE